MSIDEAKQVFDSLKPEWLKNLSAIENEQETRFKVIDRILIEVLGWTHNDIKPEKHTDEGYVDYLVESGGRGYLVVEAKKAGAILVDTKNPSLANYKIGGEAIKSARAGIAQARRYCLATGVSFAALTTGIEWIGFLAVRTDGIPADNGKAIVFPSLDAISNNFAQFYDLFSKEGVTKGLYTLCIREAEGFRLQEAEKLYSIFEPSNIRLLSKSALAVDMERIFKEFFSTMSGDTDSEMLARCFVESRESREADASLEKITRDLINKITVMSSGKGGELERHIRYAVEAQRGEFVLIIGNKGAGKSTFIDRFFRLILDKALRKKCVLARIDMRDSTGDVDTVSGWIFEQLRRELEENLFHDESPTFKQLQDVFYKEYTRWRKGEFKHLYESDKDQFQIKFGEYIYKLVNERPDQYVRRLILHAIRHRGLMPCLIFDNTDHFPQVFQEKVFQTAQAIFRGATSFIICPITDRTIWQLSKSGPFQSYESTTFYLPIPSTKEVLRKRVDFIKEKLKDGKGQRGEYFLSKGIRLSVPDIQAFAASVEEVFINTEYVGRIISWLANHDIRRSLEIARRIITSPILGVENIVKAYLASGRLNIPERKVMQALIFGDYNSFKQEQSDFILNVFSLKPDQITTPLVKLSIIALLMNKEAQASEPIDTYISVDDVMNYLEPMGISRTATRIYLEELLERRLAEPYDPTDTTIYDGQLVKITPSGKIHREFSVLNETYVEHMCLNTPLRDITIVTKIREMLEGRGKFGWDEWQYLIRTFISYCLEQDKLFVQIPDRPLYDCEKTLRMDISARWKVDHKQLSMANLDQ